MLNRMTRTEAAKYIGCSLTKLSQMERADLLPGTFYEIGNGQRRKRIYITDKLEEWMLQGGEPAAWERKAIEQGQLKLINKSQITMRQHG